jgi:hypothetical protein
MEVTTAVFGDGKLHKLRLQACGIRRRSERDMARDCFRVSIIVPGFRDRFPGASACSAHIRRNRHISRRPKDYGVIFVAVSDVGRWLHIFKRFLLHTTVKPSHGGERGRRRTY